MNNIERTGKQDLWSATTTPWSEARIWYFPIFTRINNIEIT